MCLKNVYFDFIDSCHVFRLLFCGVEVCCTVGGDKHEQVVFTLNTRC